MHAHHRGVAAGRCTVSVITLWSYCSQTQRREAMSGVARMLLQRLPATGLLLVVSGRRRSTGARFDKGPLIDRRFVGQRRDRHVGHDLALVLDDEAAWCRW